MHFVALIFRFALAGMFISAGVSKLAAMDAFGAAIRQYELLPDRAVTVVRRALPWLEVSIGFLLGVGLLTRVASLVAAVMLLGFAGAIATSLRRGRRFDCGCFAHAKEAGWALVVRNVLLAGGAMVVAAASDPDAFSVDRLIGWSSSGGVGSALAALVVGTLAIAAATIASAGLDTRTSISSATSGLDGAD